MKMSLMQLFLHLMLDPARPSVYRRRKKDERGFTLTELMVVIFIIGLLATVVMINVLPSQDRAMVTKARADISTLENALRSEEHTSELQSLMRISYAVFCLKKKKNP